MSYSIFATGLAATFRAVSSCSTIALASTLASAARSLRFGHLWVAVPTTAFVFCSLTSNLHHFAVEQLKKFNFVKGNTEGIIPKIAFHVVVLVVVGTLVTVGVSTTAPYLGAAALTSKQSILLIGCSGIGKLVGDAVYKFLFVDPVKDPDPDLKLRWF